MLNPKLIEKIAKYLHKSIPKNIYDFKQDLDLKIKNILQMQLSKMNFINRHEFDIQKQVLLKIQEQLKKLERKIAKIESNFQYKTNKNKKHKK